MLLEHLRRGSVEDARAAPLRGVGGPTVRYQGSSERGESSLHLPLFVYQQVLRFPIAHGVLQSPGQPPGQGMFQV